MKSSLKILFCFSSIIIGCKTTFVKCPPNGERVLVHRNPEEAYPVIAKEYKAELKNTIHFYDGIIDTVDLTLKSKVIELREKLNQDNIETETLIKPYVMAYNNHPCDTVVRNKFFEAHRYLMERTLDIRKSKTEVKEVLQDKTTSPPQKKERMNNIIKKQEEKKVKELKLLETGSNLRTPIITTLPVSDLTQTSATLNGEIDPHNDTLGWACFVLSYPDTFIEIFVDTMTYNFSEPYPASKNAITSKQTFSYTISDLLPGMTYSYFIRAMNKWGVANGENLSFETLTIDSIKPTVVTLKPIEITQTSAMIKGIVNPNGLPTASWFEIFEMHENNYGTKNFTGNNSQPLSFTLADLTPGKEYTFRICAINEKGPVIGKLISFKTLP